MENESNKNQKIRVKFPGGAEFEAEGSQEFIEQQRSWFLAQLAPKTPGTRTRPSPMPESQPPLSAMPLSTVPPAAPRPAPDKTIWERLLKTENGLVYPRKKYRHLTPQQVALLLVAGAKALLNAADGYSALDLSKSLKLAGYGEGRLDRLLSAEMRDGTLKTAGSKRARSYILSDEGFARAFVLAEKLEQTVPF